MSKLVRYLPIFLLFLSTSVRAAIRRIAEDCYADCSPLYRPVCGSDGENYNNECELLGLAACRGTPELHKVQDRPCDVGTVVLLGSYEWDLTAPKVKIDAKSAITINVVAKIDKKGDSLSGRNLWRVGIFGSEWPDGFGQKYGYVEQILSKKQASKKAQKGKFLKLKKLRTRFDLSQIGCGAVAYFCVELAKNDASSVDFELRAGILVDSIVACKRLDCQRPDVEEAPPTDDLPPTCFQTCPPPALIGGAVCGNNSVTYESFCEITKAARCQRVPVKIAFPGPCPPEVVVTTLFWTAIARTNEENFRIPLLDVEVGLFNNNDGVNITGNDLWQVSLYGSKNESGLGEERVANVEQALGPELRSKPLRGGYPFDLVFTIPFNTYAVGCEDAPYFCLEIKRNPNASTKFVIKKTSQETTVISCREVPCIPPPSDKRRLMFNQVRWNIFVDNFRFNHPSDLNLNISVDVQDNSEAINDGRNLWNIGIYGSSDPNGAEGEKLNFIKQVLEGSDSVYSPDVVPGRTMVFPLIATQFDISAIGCGEYRYLCVVLAKHPAANPDFEISNNLNKRKVISCQQVQCIGADPLPPPPPTAILRYLDWNLTIASVREDGAYNLHIAVNIEPDPDTDTIEGTGLWRVGIFLSNASSGVMATSQYQPDILTEEHKAYPLVQGEKLLFTGLEATLNLEGVGCSDSSLRFACLEFAQGASPEPHFVLPLGATGVVRFCRALHCSRTSADDS